MTEILLKKDVKSQVIHPSIHLTDPFISAPECAEDSVTNFTSVVECHDSSSCKYRVKLVEYRVKMVEYRVKLVEYHVKIVEYRVKLVKYRVKMVEYRVKLVEY